MAEEKKSLLGRFMDWVRSNHAQQPKLVAQLEALGREARKDINSTLHQVFFGRPTGIGEPGAPLVPTQAQVTKDLGNGGACPAPPFLEKRDGTDLSGGRRG